MVRNLGRIAYLDALRIQKTLARHHLDFKKDKSSIRPRNVLFICEHNPVYTIGIRNKTFGEEEKNKLKKLGAEFYTTDRGGLITFHGPGQLVCYPVLDLGDFKKSIRWYVRSLEDVLIDTCARYDVEAGVTDDTGVWVEDRKIAAIGVQASRWVTTHGVALNCNTDLTWFDHIVPCGIVGKGVTSLSFESKSEININDATTHFLASFSDVFNCQLRHFQELSNESILVF
ncbi:putative lipoyltransferase 2, mitochondrial [Actinia tenebrosa]|uniref:Octanoyl-[acyl-carrier-protein]:protein N-octanoyltransferase LIPT2, mitochondrial n=1 Tax=Actinia tenebrosa TaxID=6105 RepID=A0A6P8HVJ7_ACTTE|nr:putative lipoyltransferase 2, mitochondrial [Actinia tenebrosa]